MSRRTAATRSAGGSCGQGPRSNAVRAAATARSTSAGPAPATAATTCSVCGDTTSSTWSVLGATHSPPMNSRPSDMRPPEADVFPSVVTRVTVSQEARSHPDAGRLAKMRLGVMLGPERGRYATKVERMLEDARWAEEAGLSSLWIPQIPDDFDALTAAALIGSATSRIEIGTAVVPVEPRPPIALAQQALSVQAVAQGRLALGLGVSHHWVIEEMLGLKYEKPAPTMRAYLDVLEQAFRGPGLVEVDNDAFTVRNPLDITDVAPTQVLIAALGPLMLKLAGERTDGTILWLADERAIETHVAPRINAAAEAAGRATPRIVAGIPVCLCADSEIDTAVARTNRILSE